MTTAWPVGREKVNRCKKLARALHVHTTPQLIKSYGAKQALPRCTHVPSLVSLAQSFLKPEDPMSKKFSSPGACSLHPTRTATTKAHRLGSVRVTCQFRIGGASCSTCRCVNNFLQTFTRRHVPRATCRRSTPDRCYRRSGGSVRRSVVPRSRSVQPFGRY